MTARIIIIVVILLVITIIASLLLLQKPPTETPPAVTTSTSASPTVSLTDTTDTFYISSIYPPEEQANDISILASVKINFNEPINKDTFFYKVSPELETSVKFASDSATISPKTSWPMGQEIIITVSSVQSASGAFLPSPYIIKMQVPIPQGE